MTIERSVAPPHRMRIALAFAALYVIGGSTFLGQRVVVHGGFTPFLGAGLRMAIAGCLLLGWSRLRGVTLAPRRTWLDLAISGTFLFVGGNALSMIASQTVASGLVALLAATCPFWLTLGASRLPGGERPTATAILGMALGFAGLVVVVAPGIAGGGGGPAILAAAVSPVAWAIGALWARYRLAGLSTAVIASHQMVFGTLPLIAIGLARGEWAQLDPRPDGIAALGFLVVCGNLITYSSFVFLLARVAAAKVSTYAYVNPVVAVILGRVLADEHIALRGLIGAAAIIAGVVLVNLAQIRRRGHIAQGDDALDRAPQAGVTMRQGARS